MAGSAFGALFSNAIHDTESAQRDSYALEQADGPEVCPEIDQQIIDDVEGLLTEANSELPAISRAELEAKYDVTIPHAAIESFETSLLEDKAEILTESATGEVNQYYSQPYSYYQDKATEILAAYGIDLVVLEAGQTMDGVSMFGYSPDDMQTQAAKSNLVKRVRELYEAPVELIQYLGARKVIVGNVAKANTAGYANTVPFPDAVFIDALGGNPRTLMHEIGHIWDAQYCGESGMYDDPQFAVLMPKSITPGDRSLESKKLGSEENEKSTGRIVATTNYALDKAKEKNIVENKAEIIAQIAILESYETLPRTEPFVSAQHRLLVARLYQDTPNVMAYMIELQSAN